MGVCVCLSLLLLLFALSQVQSMLVLCASHSRCRHRRVESRSAALMLLVNTLLFKAAVRLFWRLFVLAIALSANGLFYTIVYSAYFKCCGTWFVDSSRRLFIYSVHEVSIASFLLIFIISTTVQTCMVNLEMNTEIVQYRFYRYRITRVTHRYHRYLALRCKL